MYEIILIRHGETEYNRAERLQGRADSPLTAEGREMALELGRAFNQHMGQVDEWIVSPLGRTRQSSKLIRSEINNIELPAETFDDLIVEIDCGELEGTQQRDIDPGLLRKIRQSADVPYPGGESQIDVMDRCRRFLAVWQARQQGVATPRRVVIVSHGNLIRAMASVICELGPAFCVRALMHNLSVSRFIARDESFYFRLVSWNDRTYLSGHNPFVQV